MTRRLVPAALLAAGALALTGCGTGLHAQVYKERSPRHFDNASLGALAIRNLAIQPPVSGEVITAADDSAILTGAVVNTGDEADALTGATSPVATNAQLQVDGNDVTSVPLPAGGTAGENWAVVLSGLRKDLRAGQYVEVTLTFDKAGRSQTLAVPVLAGNTGLGDREPAQDPYHTGE